MRAWVVMLWLVGCGAAAPRGTAHEALVLQNHLPWPFVLERAEVFVDGRSMAATEITAALQGGAHVVSVRAVVSERCSLDSDRTGNAWVLRDARRVRVGPSAPLTIWLVASALDTAPSMRWAGAPTARAPYADDGRDADGEVLASGAPCDPYAPPSDPPPTNVPWIQWQGVSTGGRP